MLRRLISLIPILFGVTILTYGLMYISPQDPGGDDAQGQGTAWDPRPKAMRHQLGLIGLLWYSILIGCGDLYVETWELYIDGAAVSGKLLMALPNTLKLTVASVIVTILLSVPLGILAA
ncbi:MAG: hypothetical protein ACLTSZ_02390 [Lachnospiraceae bacterium]